MKERMYKLLLLLILLPIVCHAQESDVFKFRQSRLISNVTLETLWFPAVAYDFRLESEKIETSPSVFEDFEADLATGQGWGLAINALTDENVQVGFFFMNSFHEEKELDGDLSTYGLFTEAGIVERRIESRDWAVHFHWMLGLGGVYFDFDDEFAARHVAH